MKLVQHKTEATNFHSPSYAYDMFCEYANHHPCVASNEIRISGTRRVGFFLAVQMKTNPDVRIGYLLTER